MENHHSSIYWMRQQDYSMYLSTRTFKDHRQIISDFLGASQNLVTSPSAKRTLESFRKEIENLSIYDRNSVVEIYLKQQSTTTRKIRSSCVPLSLKIGYYELTFELVGDFAVATLKVPNRVHEKNQATLGYTAHKGDHGSQQKSALKAFGKEMPVFTKWYDQIHSGQSDFSFSYLIDHRHSENNSH